MGLALMMLQEEKEDTGESTRLRVYIYVYKYKYGDSLSSLACHAITPGREAEEDEERLYGLARRHVKMHAKDAFLRIRVRLYAVMAVMVLASMT